MRPGNVVRVVVMAALLCGPACQINQPCTQGSTKCTGTVVEVCVLGGGWEKQTDCNERGWACGVDQGIALCVPPPAK